MWIFFFLLSSFRSNFYMECVFLNQGKYVSLKPAKTHGEWSAGDSGHNQPSPPVSLSPRGQQPGSWDKAKTRSSSQRLQGQSQQWVMKPGPHQSPLTPDHELCGQGWRVFFTTTQRSNRRQCS
jgi:hypothetical protein